MIRSSLAAALVLAATAPNASAKTAPLPPPSVDPVPGAVRGDIPGAIPTGRLDDAVVPRAYRIDLTVDPAQPRFSGKVEIDVAIARGGISGFFLHGRGLAMHRASLTAAGRTIPARWSQVEDSGVVRLAFDQPLPAGPATLRFDYDAPFGTSATGMYHMQVAGRWYAWTQFESIDARAAFPGFDQPSYKTPFTVTLRTPPGLLAVGNAPEAAETSEDGLTVHRFAPTAPLPTYLVAMMVGPFATAATQVPANAERPSPLPLRIVAPQPDADRLGFARDNSARIVGLLEDYFGTPFPFPKLDQIVGPGVGGAMENAGAVLYDEPVLIVDPASPVDARREFGMVAAHELSHQWFGDLVTPAWWDDIWLNESFANWMGYRIGDAWRPDLDIRGARRGRGARGDGHRRAARRAPDPAGDHPQHRDRRRLRRHHLRQGRAGDRDGRRLSRPADLPRRRPPLPRRAPLRQRRQQRFLRMRSREVAGDPRIVEAMRGFTDQQGVPLLTFSGKGPGYRVTQTRYAPYGVTAPSTHWLVPLCLRRGAERNCSLLGPDGGEITVRGTGPLIPNADGAGYYRFELPQRGWNALIAGAATLRGPEAQAAADSLGAEVRAGHADIGTLARLARALAPATDSYAADAAMAELAGLAEEMIADPAVRRDWQRYLATTYGPLLARYGFDPRAGAYAAEPPERAAIRALVVARLLASDRDMLVRPRLIAAAQAWLGGNAAALDPAYLRLALAVLVQAKGLPVAQTIAARALASNDGALRANMLAALAGSGRTEVASWLLDLDDPALREDERRDILRAVIAAHATRDLGYQWLMRHLDLMSASSIGIFFASRIPEMLDGFCSVARADEFERVFGPTFAGKPGALALARAIERVRNCGRLKAGRGALIEAQFGKLR